MTPTPAEPSGGREPTWLRHGHVDLALHHLREGAGPKLLILHGLGERTPATVPDLLAGWPGAVWGLDFTGHGRSTLPSPTPRRCG